MSPIGDAHGTTLRELALKVPVIKATNQPETQVRERGWTCIVPYGKSQAELTGKGLTTSQLTYPKCSAGKTHCTHQS